MRSQVLDNLAWETVVSANKTHTQLVEAQQDVLDLKRLAGLGLNGVTIEETAQAEVTERLEKTTKEHRGILSISEVLEVKQYDPNPIPTIPESIQYELPEFATMLRKNKHLGENPFRPRLKQDGFTLIVSKVQTQEELDPKYVSKVFTFIMKKVAAETDSVRPSYRSTPSLDLTEIDDISALLNTEDEFGKRKVGPTTLGIFDIVRSFVEANHDQLFGVETPEV